MLRQHRAFTFAAVAALALGIGATTAVFSVVDAILLRPFPYPDPDRIVLFMNKGPNGSGQGASPAKYAHWSRQTDVVEDASAYSSSVMNYTGGDTPEQVTAGRVGARFFHLLGAKTILGRTFTPEETLPNGPRVAVLSYGWWTRRFGSDPKIIGKTISLSGDPYVVIGVIGSTFDPSEFGNEKPDVWTAFQIDPNTRDQAHYFMVAGRLKPGVTLAQAQARLSQSADEFKRNFPNSMGPRQTFTVEPIQKVLVRKIGRASCREREE